MRYLLLLLLGCPTHTECELFCEAPACVLTLCTERHGDTATAAWFTTGDGLVFHCDGVDCAAAQQEALNHCGLCEVSADGV